MFSLASSSPWCRLWSRRRAETWAGQWSSPVTGRVLIRPNTRTHISFKPFFPFVRHSFLFGSLRILYLLAQVLVSLAAVLLLCLLLKSFLIGPYYKKLHAESKGNKEILVLGMAAFVFFMLTVCTDFNHLVLSEELSCLYSFHYFQHFFTNVVWFCLLLNNSRWQSFWTFPWSWAVS